ncbi:Krueppel-like factor 1 isoform X1 [Mauremys mutica]|uniref:Krueppel-like factor 1 isoform X1 n=1 Tax=Mauremys mutica TaxID=74926 RepID=UPI001D1639D2|nr:Krueppel-like factor 1 isoform X1 [Mauremys mutica]
MAFADAVLPSISSLAGFCHFQEKQSEILKWWKVEDAPDPAAPGPVDLAQPHGSLQLKQGDEESCWDLDFLLSNFPSTEAGGPGPGGGFEAGPGLCQADAYTGQSPGGYTAGAGLPGPPSLVAELLLGDEPLGCSSVPPGYARGQEKGGAGTFGGHLLAYPSRPDCEAQPPGGYGEPRPVALRHGYQLTYGGYAPLAPTLLARGAPYCQLPGLSQPVPSLGPAVPGQPSSAALPGPRGLPRPPGAARPTARDAPGQAQEEPQGLGPQAPHQPHLQPPQLRQDLYQELPPQGPSPHPHRREAVPLHLGGLRLEVRPLGRADAPLPQAHGAAPVPVPAVPARLLPLRPPGPAHEETHVVTEATLCPALPAPRTGAWACDCRGRSGPDGCWPAAELGGEGCG